MNFVFSRAYKGYALAVCTLVYALNLVDRTLIILLLQPIKDDLNLSDTQLGLLTGIAFGLFYATLGLPIARWADRGNRATIASMAIGFWGLTVMTCLWVTNFAQLALVRVAAAAGEAGCKPPTYSLVGDYFPEPADRTRAMAVYWLGSPVAALISFIIGGWLNELYGWRMTFFIMGIPGLFLGLLVKLTIIEPRARKRAADHSMQRSPPIKAVLSTLWNQRSLRHLSIALILLFMFNSGLAPWYAAIMIRTYHMGTAELGMWMGLIAGLGGIAGTLLGAYVANRWFLGNEGGQMRVSAVSVALLMPCLALFVTAQQKVHAFAALIPVMVMMTFFGGPTYALMQRLVVSETRATSLAMVMLFANLIGMGIGPLIVGGLSDLLTPSVGENALRYAMLAMSLVAFWAAYHFWKAGRTVQTDLSQVAQVS